MRRSGTIGRQPKGVLIGVASAILGTAALLAVSTYESPTSRVNRALAAAHAGDWSRARSIWKSINESSSASAFTHQGEARACLALGLAGQAEGLLHKAVGLDPADVESWRLLLQIMRVEGRTVEARDLGWQAYASVLQESHRIILLELTLSLLSVVPEATARHTLSRWVQADPGDVDAQVALIKRQSAEPLTGDPDRPSLVATLEAIVTSRPDHTQSREALIEALADIGEPNRGRKLLDQWPESTRDERYEKLRGRWDLEYDHHPERAAPLFQSALGKMPQDWRSWYRLARAYRAIGREADARAAAVQVERIRESLDPLALGRRLDDALNHLDDPSTPAEMIRLCRQASLHQLADAWQEELNRFQNPIESRGRE